jgi:hypothetical protein
MRITWSELTVAFQREKSDALLESWRWLVGDDVQLILVSSIGDLFLTHADSHVLWLDAGAARLTRIAESADEFRQLMQQPEHADRWFEPQLVGDLIVSGKRLSPSECYSYKVPPMLSGKFELDNFEVTDLLVHCSMLGQIGRQVQNMPDGTRIDRITTSEDED